MFLPARRATFLIPSGPPEDPDPLHLFIALTDPQPPDNSLLIVNINSYRQDLPHDPACYLYPGDHPFIRHTSYVNYRRARIVSGQHLIDQVQSGHYSPKGPLDEPVFVRVARGVLESRLAPPKIKQFFRQASGIQGE